MRTKNGDGGKTLPSPFFAYFPASLCVFALKWRRAELSRPR